jgi:hypothetical protein
MDALETKKRESFQQFNVQQLVARIKEEFAPWKLAKVGERARMSRE